MRKESFSVEREIRRYGGVARAAAVFMPDSRETQALAAEQMRLASRANNRRWVYFVSAGQRGPIKIGTSADPIRRITEIQSHHFMPLRILCICMTEDERSLHEEFADLRLHGEWFSPAPVLRSRIAQIIWEARKSGDVTTIKG